MSYYQSCPHCGGSGLEPPLFGQILTVAFPCSVCAGSKVLFVQEGVNPISKEEVRRMILEIIEEDDEILKKLSERNKQKSQEEIKNEYSRVCG